MAIILEPVSFIGLDIGATQARVIQLNHATEIPTLIAAGSLALNQDVLTEKDDANLQKAADKIKQLISEVGIITENAVFSLPESEVFTRIIEMPKIPKEEIAQAIQFEAESYVPYPLEEVQLDWQILEEGKEPGHSELLHALLIASPLVTIERMVKVVEMAGLKPLAIETNAIANNRALTREDTLSPCLAIVDIGAHASELCISDTGTIRLTHNIPIGGQHITVAISKELNIDEKEAEKLKLGLKKLDEVEKENIAKSYINSVEAIALEIKRSIDFYQSQPHSNRVSEIILVGRNSQLAELDKSLSTHLNMKITHGNPWSHIQCQDTLSMKQQEEMAPTFSVAVGLAMRKEL